MQGFPTRPEHCSSAEYAHLSHSPAGDGEAEGGGELETLQFTTSALSQPAVENTLQLENIQSAHMSSWNLTEKHKLSSFEEQLDNGSQVCSLIANVLKGITTCTAVTLNVLNMVCVMRSR